MPDIHDFHFPVLQFSHYHYHLSSLRIVKKVTPYLKLYLSASPALLRLLVLISIPYFVAVLLPTCSLLCIVMIFYAAVSHSFPPHDRNETEILKTKLAILDCFRSNTSIGDIFLIEVLLLILNDGVYECKYQISTIGRFSGRNCESSTPRIVSPVLTSSQMKSSILLNKWSLKMTNI